MAMPDTSLEWTLEMLHDLPEDGNRYELIDGELLVSPSPSITHQRALGLLHSVVRAYLLRISGFEVFFAPSAITFSRRRELQPDLLVIKLIDGRPVRTFASVRELALSVEILSPGTARNDRYKKRPVYQEQNTGEFWIIDQSGELVERWRPDDELPEVLIDQLEWQPDATREPLIIDLRRFFAEARGDVLPSA